MDIFTFTSIALLTSIVAWLLHSLFLQTRRSKLLPPGPTPWPIIGNLHQLGPKPHQSLAALARVHGPLLHLKIGFAHVVVAASGSVAEQFLKINDANFLSRPPNTAGKSAGYNCEDLVFAPYGPRWRLLRKICALHLFSAKALDDFKYIRQEEVGNLMRAGVKAGCNKPVRLGQMINVCATNAIARAMLGRPVVGYASDGGDGKANEFKDMIMELMVLAGVFKIGDFIPPLQRFDIEGVIAKMKKLHRRLDAFLSDILIEHKMKISQDHNNGFLTTLLSVNDGEGVRLTDDEIKALLLNLFVAGTDTTSSTVEWCIAELLRDPKILAQAQQEIDSVVGHNRFVTESDLAQLTFLQAVVKENFRLHPSTPLSLPRVAQDSCKINGYLIPKGSTLLVNVWAIARDPEVWENPLEFQPERFLKDGERPNVNVDVKGNDFELMPFGGGRRICAGMSMGIRMVQLLTASLIHAFDFVLADAKSAEKLNMDEAYGRTLQRAEPLLVQIKTRLAPHVYESPSN